MKTLQEIFAQAYTGLRAQCFRQSTIAGACAYRGDGGRKCALGHCIPDENYSSLLEGLNIWSREVQEAVGGVHCDSLSAIDRLQCIHDASRYPDTMRARLVNFALTHGLQVPQ